MYCGGPCVRVPSLQIAGAHCRCSSPLGGSLLLCRAASQIRQSLSRQEHTVCSSGEPGSWGMRSTLRPHSASVFGLPAGCLFTLDMQPWTAAPNTKHPASSWCTIPSPFWPGWSVRACTCRLAGSGCACPMWCWCWSGCVCGWRGGKGEGLRRKGGRGRGQQTPAQQAGRELDDHLRQVVRSYCAPLLAYARVACTVQHLAPERPQIDAATGPRSAVCAQYSMYVFMYLWFLSRLSVLSTCLPTYM